MYCHQPNNFIFSGDVPSLLMARRHVYARVLSVVSFMPCLNRQSTNVTALPELTRTNFFTAFSLYGVPLPDPPPRKMAWVELILWRMVTATSTEMVGPDIATTVTKIGYQTRFWGNWKHLFSWHRMRITVVAFLLLNTAARWPNSGPLDSKMAQKNYLRPRNSAA